MTGGERGLTQSYLWKASEDVTDMAEYKEESIHG